MEDPFILCEESPVQLNEGENRFKSLFWKNNSHVFPFQKY